MLKRRKCLKKQYKASEGSKSWRQNKSKVWLTNDRSNIDLLGLFIKSLAIIVINYVTRSNGNREANTSKNKLKSNKTAMPFQELK
jgi:hypothetical protein